MQKISQAYHPDLLEAQQLAYAPSSLLCHNIVREKESQEYGACTFEVNNQRITFRTAKITPTKIGQFVTFCKRIGSGPILPYDMTDPFDLFVASVRNGQHFGQFVFPKIVLLKQGIVSKDGHGGKRAIRVYPPWDVTESRQAKNTQAWQLMYFFEINQNNGIDTARVQKLFGGARESS